MSKAGIPYLDERIGDWPEDFDRENGNYQNRCQECRRDFRGMKRRRVCKVCAQSFLSKQFDNTPTDDH